MALGVPIIMTKTRYLTIVGSGFVLEFIALKVWIILAENRYHKHFGV